MTNRHICTMQITVSLEVVYVSTLECFVFNADGMTGMLTYYIHTCIWRQIIIMHTYIGHGRRNFILWFMTMATKQKFMSIFGWLSSKPFCSKKFSMLTCVHSTHKNKWVLIQRWWLTSFTMARGFLGKLGANIHFLLQRITMSTGWLANQTLSTIIKIIQGFFPILREVGRWYRQVWTDIHTNMLVGKVIQFIVNWHFTELTQHI